MTSTNPPVTRSAASPQKFTELASRAMPVLRDDIDTDQIIPARYLKVTDKEGLLEGLFVSWREDPSFAWHHPSSKGAQIVLAGANFGCGSSREHAPWALLSGGFRCVIARSFADIFRNNAMKNGLLPVALDDTAHAELVRAVSENRDLVIRVDLVKCVVSWGDGAGEARFSVDSFARECMLEGVDQLGYLLARQDAISAFETRTESAR